MSGTVGQAQHRITPDFFGMDVIDPNTWPSAPIGALGKGAGTTWRCLEPARGVFNWYGTDKFVRAATLHGVDSLYTFDATPQWASTRPTEQCYAGPVGCAAPPADIRDWENFVTALATRYQGRIKIYELWNEPTTQLEWSGTYADMVKLASAAYSIIKTLDPSAIVLTPAPSAHGYQPRQITSAFQAQWMQEYLKAGGDAFADGASFHAYPIPGACSPTLECAGAALLKQIDEFRQSLRGSRLADKPIYVTEGGWRTEADLPDPADQVAYVARWFALLASSGIARVYWHAWDDNTWGTMWDSSSGLHKAGVAYSIMHSWISGATIYPCTSNTSGLWSCDLLHPSGAHSRLVWSASGTQDYSPEPRFVRYRDLSGGVGPVHSPLLIGPAPILLVSR